MQPPRRPSKAVWALGLAIALVAVGIIIVVSSSDGDDAAVQDEGRETTTSDRATTSSDAPETTTTTLDLAALTAERQAGAEAACTEAVNAPLGAQIQGLDSYADAVWDADWSAVAPRADFDRQVAECAAPQRAVRYEAECGAPNVGLVQRDPDSHAGQCVTMYALVSQFDQATGLCGFRVWWDEGQHTYNFDYEGENAIVTMTEPCPALDAVGVDDIIRLRAVVLGGIDYETTLGGTAHAVQFWAYSAELVADN